MGCKDCDEERAAKGARATQLGPARLFTLPFADAELTFTAQGTLTPATYAIVKDWLGLVYEQLRPSNEVPHG